MPCTTPPARSLSRTASRETASKALSGTRCGTSCLSWPHARGPRRDRDGRRHRGPDVRGHDRARDRGGLRGDAWRQSRPHRPLHVVARRRARRASGRGSGAGRPPAWPPGHTRAGVADLVGGDGLAGALRAELGEPIEGAPGPASDLLLPELLRDADRRAEVPLAFVEATEVPVGDPSLRDRVGHLPAGSELLEDLDRLLEPRDRLLVASEILVDPATLDVRDRDAEPVSHLGRELAGLLDQPGGLFVVALLALRDRQRGERADARPVVTVFLRELHRAPPELVGLLVVFAGPRHPSGEEQRPREGPRVVELGRRGERVGEELLRSVEIAIHVDRDVALVAQSQGEGPWIALLLTEFHGAREGLAGLGILGEPVLGFADPGERTSLAHPPA